MNDYERIAQVIRYLDLHHAEQPDLEALAGSVELSASHFHRLFTRWAGITPKDFVQCLTLEHARTLLQQGESVLHAAVGSGLSGPGRLHDLCVTLEAASPGEIKSGGSGWKIVFGFAQTPFGECLLAESPRGICYLAFLDGDGHQTATEELQKAWPHAQLIQDETTARRLAEVVFSRERAGAQNPLRAFVRGTEFQVRVWKALLQVPPGSLTTYGRLAESIGMPSASRAVGAAVGSNCLAYLIPCHRVIRSTGVLGDYRWGQIRKRAMVAWEGNYKG